MEIGEKYANLAERASKIALREGEGLRMLYDNFDTDWKSGEEPRGIMTFTDTPALTSPPETNWKALWQAADTVAKKITILTQRLGLA